MKQNRSEINSCPQCLKLYLDFNTEVTEQEWESLGRQKDQCEPCLAALKERHLKLNDDEMSDS